MRTKFVALIYGVCILNASNLFAQEGRGTITGRVVDPTGALIVDAEIKATNTQTGVVTPAKSSDAGTYRISYLLPGTYALSAELPGFKKTLKPGIDVRVNDVLNIELALEVGDAAESVRVSGGAPLIESENVSLGQVMDTRRIQDLPLQAGTQPN